MNISLETGLAGGSETYDDCCGGDGNDQPDDLRRRPSSDAIDLEPRPRRTPVWFRHFPPTLDPSDAKSCLRFGAAADILLDRVPSMLSLQKNNGFFK